jgi:hypothetical protein
LRMNRKLLLGIAICLVAALLVFPASAKRAELCPDRSPVKQDEHVIFLISFSRRGIWRR